MKYSGSNWRYYRWHFLVGFLLLPMFGLGVAILAYIWHKIKTSQFNFDSHKIEFPYAKVKLIHLIDVLDVRVRKYQIISGISLADLHLKTADGTLIRIPGIQDAQLIASAIEKKIGLLQSRFTLEKALNASRNVNNPSPIEPLNDLVGLWQQGLISEEDFNEEKTKLSKK
jgi:hypothetical protein